MAGGYNSDLNLLYLLGSILVAALGVSVVLAWQAARGVNLRRGLPDEITAGEPFRVRVRLERRGRGPGRWSTLALEEGITGTSGTSRFSCFFPQVPAGSAVASTYEVTVPHRGEYRFFPPRLVSRFPFGLAFARRSLHVVGSFVAYPRRGRLLRAPRFPVPARDHWRFAARRESGADFRSLRDFYPGDSPRLIHWRLSAKRGKLQVRELENPAALDHVTLLLDTRLPETSARDGAAVARFETGISFAATLVEHLTGRGHAVSLLTPEQSTPATTDRRTLLRDLALVTMTPDGAATAAETRGLPEREPRGAPRRTSPLVVILNDAGRAKAFPVGTNVYIPGGPDFEAAFRLAPAGEEPRP
jgi:uncharacterized protein (DUF58 family)